MEVSITDITEVEKELRIEASAAELAPHFEDAYRRYQPKIEIRGFRKGKVPLDMVKKIHGESIEYSSLDTIAGDFYKQIVEERNIHPIGEPVMTDIDYRRGEALRFKIKYEIRPEFTLGTYTSIPLEKLIHTVTPKEIDDEILRLRKANGTLEETGTVADDEHVVTADIQQLDDAGNPLIGRKSRDAKLYLADETLFPEIRAAVRNAATGAAVRAKVDQEHEGHKHTDNLLIEIKKIEKAILPPLDDAFVKKITKEKVETVAEFREKLSADLNSYWEQRSERRLGDAIIAEIVRKHTITVPESLVRGILDNLVEEMKNRYPKKQLPPEIDEAKVREESRGYAVFQATWFLIREKIIAAEGITVGDDDIKALAARDARNVGIEEERLTEFYRNTPNVRERILSEKLIRLLRDRQAITEKVTEEYFD